MTRPHMSRPSAPPALSESPTKGSSVPMEVVGASDSSRSPVESTTSLLTSTSSCADSVSTMAGSCARQRTVSTDADHVPICSPSPLKPRPPNKEGSCVDCGGCLCCCDCHAQDHIETTETMDGSVQVHSIRLGQLDEKIIDDLFHADPIKRKSSRNLLSSKKETFNVAPADSKVALDSKDDPNQDPPSTLRTPGFAGSLAGSLAERWAGWIEVMHSGVIWCLRWLARISALYPITTVVGITVFSFAILIVGFLTNFTIQVENWYLWPPTTSKALEHTNWFYYESEFNYDTSYFDMIIHANGENVLGVEGVRRTFQAIEAIRDLDGFRAGCLWASIYGDQYYVGKCKIHSVADFWNESLAIFEDQVKTDEDVRMALSAMEYPNGVYVDEPRILGKAVRVSQEDDVSSSTRLESAESFLIEFDLPWTNVTEEFEARALKRIHELQDEWDADPNNIFRIEYTSQRSFGDEFLRAIIKDLPLLPCVFVIMTLFTCFVFWKKDRVQSRMLVGVGATVCILMSIFTGYGLLFCFGVPFTTVTTMMPFLMFGVGLDDSFIIHGSYNRLDPRIDPIERIMITMDDVGLSIFLTSFTSALAFFTGVFSSIPAVRWVCWYAFPTITIDFLYQVTFFIALIILDERRIAANRLDVCFWSIRPSDGGISEEETFEETDYTSRIRNSASCSTAASDNGDFPKATATTLAKAPPPKPLRQSRRIQKIADDAHFADKFMFYFAKKLLIPRVQAVVVVLFLIVLMGSICSASRLQQKFNYVDMVPSDSYMKDYYEAESDYTKRSGLYTYVFFRDVDQSLPEVQDQMMAYVDDLTTSGAIDLYPVYFWLRDFKVWVAGRNATFGNETFQDQILEFFQDPAWEDLYGEHVVVDEAGNVNQSRCVAFIDVDMQDTKDGTAMLDEMRAVDSRQPINHDGRERWAFLSYSDEYHILEFYNVVVKELIGTSTLGVAVISVVAIIFIPHWTAVLFVFPFITFLYVDMLGFLYIAGVQVNAISYITMVMSIGLMVDYIIHIMVRYYECKGTREQRVVETLSTMGASILVGAMSTFLGVLLLVFSTSEIIKNIFVAFIGLCTFGVLHGLVFLPTLLAMIGPES